MKITINIPPRLVRDVLAAAIEGGSYGSAWLRNYDCRVRGDYNGLYIGKPVRGMEADCNTPPHKGYIGAKALGEGIAKALEQRDTHSGAAAARVIAGTGDACDADVVLQFAAYGQLVWG